ncbi:hypothetical protein TEA_022842 [Camellia sinensis var. sinensis]|uniref:Proteasome activator complex subunit 4 C-terminal domain-containing protein n=1 Tax=Camellia sinensis var. sinensis TaxID=542762 RepID=A0A4S4DKN9_CAMSN|nr:hypothetical protein TEA_022842 [Camellia sinensis var. sinensis]
MKCRDRLHELVKEEIEKKDSSTEEWKIAMESSFNCMDNEGLSQRPYDPTDDYEFDTTVYDDDEDSFDDEYPSGFSEIDFLSDVDNDYEFSGGGSDYSDYGELHTFILSTVEKKQIWSTVEKHLTDNQVREHAATVLAGLMKGGDENLAEDFRGRAYRDANAIQKKRRQRNSSSGLSIASIHGAVLALAACVLSVPYDMPSFLPEHVTLLAHFVGESSPVKSTVTKAVTEFQRTYADTWNIQKNSFTEDQLEVLKLHLDHSGTQGHMRGSQSGGIEYAQSDVWASAYSALAAGAALIARLSIQVWGSDPQSSSAVISTHNWCGERGRLCLRVLRLILAKGIEDIPSSALTPQTEKTKDKDWVLPTVLEEQTGNNNRTPESIEHRSPFAGGSSHHFF